MTTRVPGASKVLGQFRASFDIKRVNSRKSAGFHVIAMVFEEGASTSAFVVCIAIMGSAMVPRLEAMQLTVSTLQFTQLDASSQGHRASLKIPSQSLECRRIRAEASGIGL